MERAIIKVKGIDIHVRKVGEGFPLVLLHASPSSSAMFLALAEVLKEHFTLIMPDTPGYGLSEGFYKTGDPEIAHYMPYFHELFKKMGLKRFAIYGTATGAQMAIRYGLTYPEQVEHLFLDNAAHFTDAQYVKIQEKYFPNLAPDYNGEHLLKMWTVIRDMFRYFPWFYRDESHKLQVPPLPAAVYHNIAMDFMQAGSGYSVAYRAAFGHEHVKNIQKLTVPVTIFRHTASIVLPFIDQLIKHEFHPNVQVVETPAAPGPRNETMHVSMQKELPMLMDSFGTLASKTSNSGQFLQKVEGKYIHGWIKRGGTGIAVVFVSDDRGSGRLLKDKLTQAKHPCVALSLPGQGNSDPWDIEASEEEEEILIAKLMKELGYSSFELLRSTDAIPEIDISEPDVHGMYMLKAWMELREQAGENADPERIQLLLRERLKFRKK